MFFFQDLWCEHPYEVLRSGGLAGPVCLAVAAVGDWETETQMWGTWDMLRYNSLYNVSNVCIYLHIYIYDFILCIDIFVYDSIWYLFGKNGTYWDMLHVEL